MSDLPGSYAILQPAPVAVACADFLAARARRVEKERADLIAQEIARHYARRARLRRWPLIGRMFDATPLTEEAAIRRLKARDVGYITAWSRVEFRGSLWTSEIKALQQAATIAAQHGTTVIMNANLSDLLADFFPEPSHG